ncbi:MAG: DUF3043 domain-containing protein [Microbacteriaceae bacterium]
MAKNSPESANAPQTNDADAEVVAGKGRPTPTRKEKEEARKRPLVSNDRAEARRNARSAMALEREKQRIGLANGVERYMPLRDRGPQKRYIRDYVDARTSIGEFLIPLMFFVIVLSLFPQIEIQFASTILILVFFIGAILDGVALGLIVRKKLRERFGAEKVEVGVRWYAAMRAFQLRVLRMPKPQVKRGHYPD